MRFPSLLPMLCSLVAVVPAQQEPAKQPPTTPELTKALAKAAAHNQRVLAILAPDEGDVRAAMQKDKALARTPLYEFETVTLRGDSARVLATEWKLPYALHDRPTLAVLAHDGKVLTSVEPAKFFADGKVDAKTLLPLLKPHFCVPVDAEAKLAASLAEAKKSGRNVFVRFDAPG